MSNLEQLLTNTLLVSAVCGWFTAQIIKLIIFAVLNKEWRWERIIGDGGMPSAHSATVTAMAVSAGITYGFGSSVFAVSAILAIIVMHDAMGVRRETGKQALLLREMLDIFQTDHELKFEEQLKIFVGHTPLQVTAGAVIGCIVGIIFSLLSA